MHQQTSVEVPNIKFHDNLAVLWSLHAENGWIDMAKPKGAFLQLLVLNTPKMQLCDRNSYVT
jgi:hypothetical protein